MGARTRSSTCIAPSLQPGEELRERLGAAEDDVGRLAQLARALVRRDRDANRDLEPVEGAERGEIMVPLLIVVIGFPERSAMATSLGAIGLIALEGIVFYGAHGQIKPGAAALVGIPGAFGALAGTALQQRLRNRTLSVLFALLLLAVA